MAINKKITAILLLFILSVGCFSGCIEQGPDDSNKKPTVLIKHPVEGNVVANMVMVSGTASDPDGDVLLVEIKIEDQDWQEAYGTKMWSFDWNLFLMNDGYYTISARSYDGISYSNIVNVTVKVDKPEIVESDAHKWAVFIAAANFPEDNDSKLGNGGLFLAEDMAAYFIESYGYSTSNIFILFDDGWLRDEDGEGKPIMTLQERPHDYDVTYGGATNQNVYDTLNHVINESNQFRDSEVFIWIFNHGYGDYNNSLTGGKIFERSDVFVWDDIISDRDLGELLSPLKSQKTCIIVDACFCGGFADKTILNFPTFFLLRSGLPKNGRIILTGASKFRQGYASTTQGPLFTLFWFEGITSGKADGFKPGLFERGKPTNLNLFKDGKVSVEEAFYYSSYTLRTNEALEEYDTSHPQINDRYPRRGLILSKKEMFLGES